MSWDPVIGLETHVELSTQSKMFCGCPTNFDAEAEHQRLSRVPRAPGGASGAEP